MAPPPPPPPPVGAGKHLTRRNKSRVENKDLGLIGRLYNLIQIRSNFGWPLYKIAMASG